MPPSRSPIRRSADLHGGQPVFADTPVPVQELVDHLRKGGDLRRFLDQRREVPEDVLRAVVVLALEDLIRRERLPPAPPQASLLPRTDRNGVITNAADLTADQVVHRRVLCPACRELVFRRWPEGWDAHAAFRCDGLFADDQAGRKREFKRRFGFLFR